MKDTYRIIGGKPLTGKVTLSGAKNASIKLMIAATLFDSPVTLHRVPVNEDNQNLIELLRHLGVQVTQSGNTIVIDATTMCESVVDMLQGSKIRSSFLLFGPLLKKFGNCKIPNPGGCRIGARPIDRITDGLQALGIDLSYDSTSGYYSAKSMSSAHGTYRFIKPTHTGTECLILAAVVGDASVTIENAALEPEIDDLVAFLNAGGAHIRRVDDTIVIKSVAKLVQSHPHTVIEDRNEAVTFATMAYATHGDIIIDNIQPRLIQSFLEKLHQAGATYTLLNDTSIRFKHTARLRATDITTSVHPGYMTDWQPQWGLLMSTASGTSVVHETLLEARLHWVQELKKVGAKIELFQPNVVNPTTLYQFAYDPHKTYTQAAKITGVESLHNGVMQMHDIRAGAVTLMAALGAQGESFVHGAHHVIRGYEQFENKIRALGGTIELV